MSEIGFLPHPHPVQLNGKGFKKYCSWLLGMISSVPICRSWTMSQSDFQKQSRSDNLVPCPVQSCLVPFIWFRIEISLMFDWHHFTCPEQQWELNFFITLAPGSRHGHPQGNNACHLLHHGHLPCLRPYVRRLLHPLCIRCPSHDTSFSSVARGKCYKTFDGRKLHLFTIS